MAIGIQNGGSELESAVQVLAQEVGFNRIIGISNSAGSVTSSTAGLTLVTAPFILSQSTPLQQWVKLNGSFTNSVTACGAASCGPLGYQWKLNGTNISDATNSSYAISNGALNIHDGAYSVVVSNAAGTNLSSGWQVGITSPGRLVGWGNDTYGQIDFPAATNDFVAIAMGGLHSLAVREGGRVAAWGYNDSGQATVSTNLSNVVAVAGGFYHSLALKSDGSVVAWGATNADFGQTTVPGDVNNVIAIAAYANVSYALLSNHTVRQWGQTNADVPGDLNDAIAISAGYNYCLAVTSNGAVRAWGSSALTNVPGSLNGGVVAVAAGAYHSLALTTNGTIVGWGANTFGQINTNGISNVMAIAAGFYHSVALKNDGTVVAFGLGGETIVPTPLTNVTSNAPVKMIAAGISSTMAGVFSPTNMYQVDVSKDLLLIYNTNSPNAASSNVFNYYTNNRPLVSMANVLPIGCTNIEYVEVSNFTNVILPQVQAWLTNNPTKHPQYVILFPDIPTRVHYYTNNCASCPGAFCDNCPLESLAVGLSTSFVGIQPFVTSINMGIGGDRTNDCKAYIDKLAAAGATNSGQLILSASAGGYNNTNYVLDDVRHGTGYGLPNNTNDLDYSGSGDKVWLATNGLSAAGVTQGAIKLFDGLETCLQSIDLNCVSPSNITHATETTNFTNLAGYMCWGSHSSLENEYSRNAKVMWGTNSSWWIISTVESFNGQTNGGQGNFTQWFSGNGFGGGNVYTNYQNTPIGAVSHTDEPRLPGMEDSSVYFGLWAGSKNLAICAWNSRKTLFFQVVGDPFVRR